MDEILPINKDNSVSKPYEIQVVLKTVSEKEEAEALEIFCKWASVERFVVELTDYFCHETSETIKIDGNEWRVEFKSDTYPEIKKLRPGLQEIPLKLEFLGWIHKEDLHVTILVDYIEAVSPYDLAVLFVHGIGEQRTSDTLRSWIDPVVSTLNDYYKSQIYGIAKQNDLSEEFLSVLNSKKSLSKHYVPKLLSGYDNHIKHAVDDIEDSIQKDFPSREESGGGDIIDGAAGYTEFHPEQVESTDPPNAIVDIAELEINGKINNYRWIFAESNWVEFSRPPSFSDLAYWAIGVGPLILAHYYRALTTKRNLLFKALLVAPICVLVTAIQLAMMALMCAAIVPSSWVRERVFRFQRKLLGSIGDSYVFINDDLQSLAIRNSIKKNINWLSRRSNKLIVIAHSQGAAISKEVLRSLHLERFDKIKMSKLITLGSGEIILKSLKETRWSLPSGWVTLIGFWLVTLSLLLSIGISEYYLLITVIGIVLIYYGVSRLVWDDLDEPERYFLPPIDEYFSSRDPVSYGLKEFHDKVSNYNAVEITNRKSIFTDHNTYWENKAEFVFPVIRALRSFSKNTINKGGVNHKDDKRDQTIKARLSSTRKKAVYCLQGLKLLTLFCFLVLFAENQDKLLSFIETVFFNKIRPESDGLGSQYLDNISLLISIITPYLFYFLLAVPAWISWSDSLFRNNLRLGLSSELKGEIAVRGVWFGLITMSILAYVVIVSTKMSYIIWVILGTLLSAFILGVTLTVFASDKGNT